MRVRFSFAAIASIAAVVLVASATALRAQDGVKSVADGVYSDVQAMRGAAAYDQACGRCHRQDLGGADGPALRDDRFNRVFAGKDLKTLYTRIQTTMPRGAPASMSESAYLDITRAHPEGKRISRRTERAERRRTGRSRHPGEPPQAAAAGG